MLRTHHQRPTPWNRRRAFSRAFSLVELTMVLLIAGIIAAIAVPRLSGSMGQSRALAAARRVAADLETARAAAMATSASRKVVFTPTKCAYGTTGNNQLDRGASTYLVDLSRAPYNASIPAANLGDNPSLRWTGVYDLDAAQEVVFDGFGRPDQEGWVVVGSGEFFYKVTLDRAGRTSIARVQREDVGGDISITHGVLASENAK
ncbi:MAG TPA: prepilin-type N-terminal cleavage/methylation domain-containing protein [Phycisphaerales bacterium]|nr:prepilin-type N-terminal cleavage/methylation domain-containing protein [Phycisphaerales bacterium]